MSNIVSRLRISQEHELLQKLVKAGLDSALAQKVIDSKDNDLAKRIIGFIRTGEQRKPPRITLSKDAGRRESIRDILRRLSSAGMRVVDHIGVRNFWNVAVPRTIRIRYSEKTLREAIAANQNGEQWALAFYSGMSLIQMRHKKGVNTSNQLWFCNNDWWLKSSEDSWTTRNLEPGYYLLNFNGQFGGINWTAQETAIAALGPMYERAHENIVSETVISNFGIHSGERLLENWYHWGKETDSGGYRVSVGNFDSDGCYVYYCSPDDSYDYIRVVVSRKFDS